MQKVATRVWILEKIVKAKAEAAIEADKRSAYTRIMAALHDALPGDPLRFEICENGWGRSWIIDKNDRSHADMLIELNGRIKAGTLIAADHDLLASLSADDLVLIGSTTSQIVEVACSILAAY